MKRKYLVVLILALLVLSGCAQPTLTDISVEDAKQMIDTNQDVIILDVRSQSEYDSAHIDGATLIPKSELEDRIGELDKGKKIIVYCRSGVRSLEASVTLTKYGFQNIYNMLGGINAWIDAKYPVIMPATLPAK